MFFLNKNEKNKLKAMEKNFAIIAFSPDGKIKSANHNFLKTMNYELNEITGKHHSIFCRKIYSSSKEYSLFWENLNKGIPINKEFIRVKKDGTLVFLQASYTPIIENQKVVEVIKFATDITERAISNNFNESLLDAVSKSNAIIEFDNNGTILNANENFLKTLGYKLNEIVGKHHSIFCDLEYVKSNNYKELIVQNI